MRLLNKFLFASFFVLVLSISSFASDGGFSTTVPCTDWDRYTTSGWDNVIHPRDGVFYSTNTAAYGSLISGYQNRLIFSGIPQLSNMSLSTCAVSGSITVLVESPLGNLPSGLVLNSVSLDLGGYQTTSVNTRCVFESIGRQAGEAIWYEYWMTISFNAPKVSPNTTYGEAHLIFTIPGTYEIRLMNNNFHDPFGSACLTQVSILADSGLTSAQVNQLLSSQTAVIEKFVSDQDAELKKALSSSLDSVDSHISTSAQATQALVQSYSETINNNISSLSSYLNSINSDTSGLVSICQQQLQLLSVISNKLDNLSFGSGSGFFTSGDFPCSLLFGSAFFCSYGEPVIMDTAPDYFRSEIILAPYDLYVSLPFSPNYEMYGFFLNYDTSSRTFIASSYYYRSSFFVPKGSFFVLSGLGLSTFKGSVSNLISVDRVPVYGSQLDSVSAKLTDIYNRLGNLDFSFNGDDLNLTINNEYDTNITTIYNDFAGDDHSTDANGLANDLTTNSQQWDNSLSDLSSSIPIFGSYPHLLTNALNDMFDFEGGFIWWSIAFMMIAGVLLVIYRRL